MEMVRRLAGLETEVERLKTMETPHLNSVINDFLLLPGLVGFWPMSSVQRSTGDVYDLSGQGRTLTYNGNPEFNIYSDLVSYIDLDGTGDYLSRADETDLDIQGTETIFASAVRGLTWGLWIYPEETGTVEAVFTKFSNAAGNYSFRLILLATDAFRAQISDDGTNLATVDSATISMSAWYLVIARFIPGDSIELFVNGVWTTQSTARASAYNGAADLNIGAQNNGSLPFQGRGALPFLCATALSDNLIKYLYRRSRALFI